MREKLYYSILTATVSFAVPKVIDLLSQLTLYIIQQLFQQICTLGPATPCAFYHVQGGELKLGFGPRIARIERILGQTRRAGGYMGLLHEDITREVLGAAFEVHAMLGPGFLETAYETALAHELTLRGIPFERQVRVPVRYKRILVVEHILDLIVRGMVVVELKAIADIADVHKAITLSYLTATSLNIGLILNFGQPSLQYKRIIRNQGRP